MIKLFFFAFLSFLFTISLNVNSFSLKMACDYYTYKYLDIVSKNRVNGYIELDREKGYFWGHSIDEDEDNYDEKLETHYTRQLESDFVPITIYENNNFISKKIEERYMTMVQEYCKLVELNIEDILKIVKDEKKMR